MVYRGMQGAKLPEKMLKKNSEGVRGGIEYAFMSTTLDAHVAIGYAGADGNAPVDATKASTLFETPMGMIDRGAQLDWLSQYPQEKEILLPPLTAVEVRLLWKTLH
eukprot:SAG31_NODE_455_length_15433_cov_4.248728_4_plen_106_part_00